MMESERKVEQFVRGPYQEHSNQRAENDKRVFIHLSKWGVNNGMHRFYKYKYVIYFVRFSFGKTYF